MDSPAAAFAPIPPHSTEAERSVLGAMLVTLLPEVFRSLSNYRMLIYGFAVVLIIMFRPNGLYGYKEFSLKRTIAWFKKLFGGSAKAGKEEA